MAHDTEQGNMMDDYDIGDIVEVSGQQGEFNLVTGVIHDQERIFVTGPSCIEAEFKFSEVTDHWRKQ